MAERKITGKCNFNSTKIGWQDPWVGKKLLTFLAMTRFQIHGVLVILVKAATLTSCKTKIFFHYVFCRTGVAVVQDFSTLYPNTFPFPEEATLWEWNCTKFLWHHFPTMPLPAAVLSGMFSSTWRVITIVLTHDLQELEKWLKILYSLFQL